MKLAVFAQALLLALILGACGTDEPAPAPVVGFLAPPGPRSDSNDSFPELDWLELMPQPERDALLRGEWPEMEIDHDREDPMAQFGSAEIVAAIDGRQAMLPGYVVPLELTSNGKMRSFFLVPYYGACIHVPPPPPNQIVYAELDEPGAIPDLWEPMRLSGRLRTVSATNELAHAAYRMDEVRLVPWE